MEVTPARSSGSVDVMMNADSYSGIMTMASSGSEASDFAYQMSDTVRQIIRHRRTPFAQPFQVPGSLNMRPHNNRVSKGFYVGLFANYRAGPNNEGTSGDSAFLWITKPVFAK